MERMRCLGYLALTNDLSDANSRDHAPETLASR